MSHGEFSSCPDIEIPYQRPLPGTARQRMRVGIAAGGVYRAMLDSDLDLTLEGLQQITDVTVGRALFELLDACHILLDC